MGKEMFALWGEEKGIYRVNQKLLDHIKSKVGLDTDEIVWSGYCKVPDLPASSELKEILLSCVSPENISFEPTARFRHSIGMGGLDYIKLMEGKDIRTVDAVIYPSEEEIECLLKRLDKRIEIVPYGGGTTVTGGILPSGKRKYAVSLDTKKLDFMKVDAKNNLLEAGTGLTGPQIESELEKYGLTLGNFPESFHYSALGGWIATNAAGQESNRYGKVKDMVVGLRMVSPSGIYQDRIVPGESAFFKLSDVAVGSEGSFGIVTRAWLRLHQKPVRLYYRSYMLRSFEEGIERLRKEFTSEKIPLISRLSDEVETQLYLMGTEDNAINNLFRRYVAFRMKNKDGALLVTVSDKKAETSFEGGVNLSSIPSKMWYRERYSKPLIYNELLRRGIVAETIETSGKWEDLSRLYRTTREKFNGMMNALKVRGLIMCHSSHQYVSGSALYFTFIYHAKNDRASILEKIRAGIMENILANGGSISHHHGIGTIQSEYLKDYKTEMYGLIREVKSFFDPDNSISSGVLPPKSSTEKLGEDNI